MLIKKSIQALDNLHKAIESHEKHILESDEDAHTDKLLQLRMANLQIFTTSHYKDSPKRKKMLECIHELRKLSTLALEHKE